MSRRQKTLKISTVLWALGLAGVLVFFGGAVLLPSTKRASFSAEEVKRRSVERQRELREAEAAATTRASTRAATRATVPDAREEGPP